jgi:hypothetical protein
LSLPSKEASRMPASFSRRRAIPLPAQRKENMKQSTII